MSVTDYNDADGKWSRAGILLRYAKSVAKFGIVARDLSPREHSERGRCWVYPVMEKVIEGIEAGDIACVEIGIDFIEEDRKFPFGKIIKAKTACVLRRAELSSKQRRRILARVFGMLRDGKIPHEFREYAKLARKIGFELSDVPTPNKANQFVLRFQKYFEAVARKPE
jgi:hypothetical protein